MFVELHMIQNFAPSNLNRDDTNNPKDCVFGGVRRARISSQCLKRAIRFHPDFEKISGVPVSQRTRLLVSEVKDSLENAGISGDSAQNRAELFAKHYSSKKAKMDGERTNVMLFISQGEKEEISQELVKIESEDDIKKYAEEFAKSNRNRPGAPDIALFGRMLADRPETNVDAACQVAHAISTHRVAMELDFFTAVDDLLQEDESGAGMMGTTAFNSACLYRYACIDFQQLVKNLGGDVELARNTIEAFLHAAVFAVPSGKQNSFAAHNPPHLLVAVLRENGQCLSLANAFEKPVHPVLERSLLQASVEALDAYWGKIVDFFGSQGRPITAVLDNDVELKALQESRVADFSAWMKEVMNGLPQE